MTNPNIRNIAIIAHVDHGKTTLVDEMLKQSGTFRENQVVAERVMDSNDIERERGITILAKNTSIRYGDVKINIIDTPGHADFGGEVERVLKMVDGVILLVDAAEGPMPQTVNKIDRQDARLDEIEDEVLELFMDLEANDDQLDSPFLFCSARAGIASNDPFTEGTDLRPLFDKIIEYIPEPSANCDEPMRLLVSSIDYNDYVGRIAIGRVESGIIRQNQEIVVCDYHNQREPKKAKITAMYQFEGLERVPVTEATAGNIICLSGIAEITIGDTICDTENPEPLPFVKISEPTVEMTFSVNDSPFAGREGKFVTTRNIKDRLERELLKDISLRVTPAENSSDAFIVSGRGEMHLSILIETMRREGYEFQVSTPRVLMREIDGVMCEPMEEVVADVPGDCSGSVIEKLCSRKGELRKMSQVGSRTRIEFIVPARGLFGYRNEFLTDTKGEGILNSIFHGYSPSKGDIPRRATGSLIAYETGEAVGYGIFNVQDRGSMFVSPGDNVYAGMIVGVSNKADDIVVNVCKKKQLTNMRASGSDDALRLVPPRILSLEQMLEFLADDELLEVTPESLRMRKRLLDHSARMKLLKGKQQ